MPSRKFTTATLLLFVSSFAQSPPPKTLPGPNSRDDDFQVQHHARVPLSAALGVRGTIVVLAQPTLLPVPASLTIDDEILDCYARTETTFTCARGRRGTTAAPHALHAMVYGYAGGNPPLPPNDHATPLSDLDYPSLPAAFADAQASARPLTIHRSWQTEGPIHITEPIRITILAGVTLTVSGLSKGMGALQFEAGSDGSSLTGSGYTSLLTRANGGVNNSYLIRINAPQIALRNLRLSGNGSATSRGEHAANIFAGASASHLRVDNIWSDNAQGDGLNLTTETFGCVDVKVTRSHFLNMGRSFVVVAGYGCDRVQVTGNDFDFGEIVQTSTSHGASIDFEPDYVTGTSVDSLVAGNRHRSAGFFLAYSFISTGFRDTGNTGTMQHTSANLAGCHTLVNPVSFVVSGNTCTATGGTGRGEAGIYYYLTLPGTGKDAVFEDNSMTGMTGPCYVALVTAGKGIAPGTSLTYTHNTGRGCEGGGLRAGGSGFGAPETLSVRRNEMYDVKGDAYHAEGAKRHTFSANIARQYESDGLSLSCNVNFPEAGGGDVEGNEFSNTNVASQTGLHLDSSQCSSGGPLRIRANKLAGNKTPAGGSGVDTTSLQWENSNQFGTSPPVVSEVSPGWGAGAAATISGTDSGGAMEVTYPSLASAPWTLYVTYGTAFPYRPRPALILQATAGAACTVRAPSQKGFQIACEGLGQPGAAGHLQISWAGSGSTPQP